MSGTHGWCECTAAAPALQVAEAPHPVPPRSLTFPAVLLRSITLAVLPRHAAPAAVWISLWILPCGSRGRAPNPEQLKKPTTVYQLRCSKATLCSNLAGGPSQTCLPKNKRESFETPVVSVQRKMCHGRGREGVGEKPMELCRLHCWSGTAGTRGRCLWSSSWHQVCPKLWQAAEHRALFQTLQPLLWPQQSSLDMGSREESLLQMGKPNKEL